MIARRCSILWILQAKRWSDFAWDTIWWSDALQRLLNPQMYFALFRGASWDYRSKHRMGPNNSKIRHNIHIVGVTHVHKSIQVDGKLLRRRRWVCSSKRVLIVMHAGMPREPQWQVVSVPHHKQKTGPEKPLIKMAAVVVPFKEIPWKKMALNPKSTWKYCVIFNSQ